MIRISAYARLGFPFAALGLLAIAGCTVTSGTASDAGSADAGMPDAGASDGGGSDDGGADGGAQDGGMDATGDAAACNGSQIPAQITSNMTLTRACSPWHLTGPSVVGDASSPTLTIEPGVTILADQGAALVVGASFGNAGGIHAVGTSSSPIVFTSSAATPKAGDWSGVLLGTDVRADAQLGYVEIDYAGAAFSMESTPASSLIVGEATNQAIALPLSNVTLKHNAGNGLLLSGSQVGFGPGSGNLTITDWGSGMSPIALNANQASTLAGVSFSTGASGHDGQVQLDCDDTCNGGMAIVQRTQTWPTIPVPYLAAGAGFEIDGAGTSHATLTIASGNTVMFTNQGSGGPTGIVVDYNANGQADLVASNVHFTSNSPSPTAGSWGGILFNMTGGGLPNSSLTNCTFDWAGGNEGTVSYPGGTCSGFVIISNSNAGAVGPTISGCTFESYASTDAILINDTTGASVTNAGSYQTGNTFKPNSGMGAICSTN